MLSIKGVILRNKIQYILSLTDFIWKREKFSCEVNLSLLLIVN